MIKIQKTNFNKTNFNKKNIYSYIEMINFDTAIEKLLRRIQRATSKGKWKKVDRLSKQLEQLYDLQEQAESEETESQETESQETESQETESQQLPSGSSTGSQETSSGTQDSTDPMINDNPIINDDMNEADYHNRRTEEEEEEE